MTINEVYVKTLMKVNKNLGSNNATLDKQKFVLMYNEEQIRRISHILINENNDDGLKEIQMFLKPHQALINTGSHSDRAMFKLPVDYFEVSSVYSLASKDECKDKKLFLWEIKDKNYTEKLSDNYNKPSFEYREAPYIISDNNVNIFTNDFSISSTYLTYYRYPVKVDMEGYINLQNMNSTTINPEGDARFIDKVTSMVAESYAINYENIQKFQLEQNRIITNT